jgi:hypothetical protein
LPDERKKCPTNVLNLADIGLEDIQPGRQVLFVAFPNWYLIAKDIDNIPPYIIYFIDVYNIRTMNFEEGLADQFFFHIFQRAIGNIAL